MAMNKEVIRRLITEKRQEIKQIELQQRETGSYSSQQLYPLHQGRLPDRVYGVW